VRVALVNDHELIVRGLHAMLAPYAHRIEVVDLVVGPDGRSVVDSPVDVALYDSFSQPAWGEGVDSLVTDPNVGAVVVYTWNMHPELIARARERKVRGYVSKHLGGPQLVEALLRVAAGGEVVAPAPTTAASTAESSPGHGDWPGREHGLTQRQAEVVSLITQGLTNQDIAERTYITLNTLKTYIRQAYQRMGVTTRAQAVLWGVEHGLLPRTARQDDPPGDLTDDGGDDGAGPAAGLGAGAETRG
jgi:DNA-binding NarL/FixJ family response regulator